MQKLKPYMHPKEVFQILASWEAEIEEAKNYKPVAIPKYSPTEVKKKSVGWTNFFRQLRP